MTETERLFTKILVATDGSAMNRAALREAFRIGRACGSVVHAVYVADTSALESGPADMMVGEAWEILPIEGERALARVREEAAGVHLETALLYGKPAEEIVRYAREKGVDLIVIGSQGKQGIARLLLGSVAEKVIRTAGCKVFVVK
jgi:nucleotide-binding universal stress UspA family protein